ncbi:EAL domain-containing protein [Pseudomonas sp. WS 5532]|uniref:EAL domain-containing protein n=1 Tax=Pseudomonas sp. WS 5532 TaxID=2717495 RepID=UPI001473CD42|nr:EAL domain-containing protein [Pseudomonas sp. WS 5532]NMX77590.1 EAL domain-containing protein [Pseudomonas sp. WS 5532]
MRNVVKPVFQPIVDARSGAVSHYEALARTNDGGNGHVQLLQLGEQYGFIHLIDLTVIGKVIRLLRDRPGVRVAVNVSVLTIENADNELLALVFQNMDIASQLIFEITETAEIRTMERIHRFVSAVRLLGAKVAIDDFGDGFFTVAQVREIQPDYLKLCGDLVARLCKSGEILPLRELARSFGGELIAEHVDSEEKLCRLRDLSVGLVQGFHVGRILTGLPSAVVGGDYKILSPLIAS